MFKLCSSLYDVSWGKQELKPLYKIRCKEKDKIKGFILIGSVPGGDKTFHVIMPEYCELEYRTAAVLLQPNESGNPRAWLDGNMIESNLVKLRLKHFVSTVWKEWNRKQRTGQNQSLKCIMLAFSRFLLQICMV
jgi:hypothetical protein